LECLLVMGWTPSRSKRKAGRTQVGSPRFDPWQGRPDRQVRRRTLGRSRALMVWLAVFAVLALGYAYGSQFATAGWRVLTQLFPRLGAG
jgi:hypothetical protein